jgi:SSS family solute:Na+ symporter
MVLFGLAWIPLMDVISGQLYVYLQSVQAYISPPIAAVFLIGVLWARANARGALAALLTGLVLGVGRLVLEVNELAMPAAAWFVSMNFLHFAVLLFIVCAAVLVLVSVWTPAPDLARIAPLTVHYHRHDRGERPSHTADVVLSVLLVGLVVAAWLYFA